MMSWPQVCPDVPRVWRNFPPLVFHDLGVLVCRAVARSEPPSWESKAKLHYEPADVIGLRCLKGEAS